MHRLILHIAIFHKFYIFRHLFYHKINLNKLKTMIFIYLPCLVPWYWFGMWHVFCVFLLFFQFNSCMFVVGLKWYWFYCANCMCLVSVYIVFVCHLNFWMEATCKLRLVSNSNMYYPEITTKEKTPIWQVQIWKNEKRLCTLI